MSEPKHSEREAFDPMALTVLRNNQQQLDADGIMVGVSRQALDMAIAYIDRIELEASRASKPEGVDEPFERVVFEYLITDLTDLPMMPYLTPKPISEREIEQIIIIAEAEEKEGDPSTLGITRTRFIAQRLFASLAHPAPQDVAMEKLSAFIHQVDAQTIHGASEDDYAKAILARYHVTEKQATGGGDER